MKAKKIIYLFVVSIILSSCVNYEEVSLSDVKSIEVLEIGNESLKIETELKLNNPNSYDIKVTKSMFDVYIKDNKIGNASITSPLTIKSNSNEYQTVKLQTIFEKGQQEKLPTILAMAAFGGGGIDFKLDGFVEGKAMFIKKRIDLVHEGKVPLDLFK